MARNWLNCSFSDLLGDRKSSFFWTWLQHIRTSDSVASLRARRRSDSYDAVGLGIIFLEYLAYCILYIPHIFMNATCSWGVLEISCREREGRREVIRTDSMFMVVIKFALLAMFLVCVAYIFHVTTVSCIYHCDRCTIESFCVCLTLSLKSFMYNVTQLCRLFVIIPF